MKILGPLMTSFNMQKNFPGMILLVDVLKTFDSVNFDFAQNCLEFLGFRPNFLQEGEHVNLTLIQNYVAKMLLITKYYFISS